MPAVSRIPSSITARADCVCVMVWMLGGLGRGQPFLSGRGYHVTHRPPTGEVESRVGFGGGQLLPKLPRDSHASANTKGSGTGRHARCHHGKSLPLSGIWGLALPSKRPHAGHVIQPGPGAPLPFPPPWPLNVWIDCQAEQDARWSRP